MKITSITARNFKCGNFNYKLAPITIFVGPNGKGKTSVLNATNIAISGKDPSLKKKSSKIDAAQTAADIMAFGCGNPMSAAVTLEDTRLLQRTYTEKKGKTTCEVSPACDGFEVPGVLTDPAAYLSMTATEQRDYVCANVPMPDSKTAWTELVAELKNHSFPENTVHTEEAIKKLVQFIHETVVPLQKPVQEQMEFCIAQLKEQKSNVDAAVKRMTGTVQGVTELAGETVLDPSPEISQAKAALERLLGEQRDLQNALNRAKEVQAQREKIQSQITELQESVHPAVKDQLLDELEALRKSIAEYVSQTEVLDAQVQSLSNTRFKSQQDGATMGQNVLKAQQQVAERTRLETELATAQAEALGLAELEAELRQKQERQQVLAKSSRIVEQDEMMLRDMIVTLKGLGGKPLISAAYLEVMLENNATQIIDTGVLQVDVAKKRYAAGKVTLVTQQIALLPPKPDLAALEQSLAQKRTEYQSLDTDLKALEQRLKDSRAADTTIQTSRITLAQKEAELGRMNDVPVRVKELEAQLETLVVPVLSSRTAEIDDAIILARREIFVLDTRYKQFIAQKSEAATKQKALNQRLLLEAESAACKVAVELVQTKQAEMVQCAFVDILRVANMVTKDVLDRELEYRDGEIGMFVNRNWITHRTMSGSQQMVTFAALSVSLAVKSPVRVLMLDEIGRVDAEHSVPLIRNLCTMIETGALDNVLLTGLVAPEMPDEVRGSELVSVVNL